jgi:hypothetical protein
VTWLSLVSRCLLNGGLCIFPALSSPNPSQPYLTLRTIPSYRRRPPG